MSAFEIEQPKKHRNILCWYSICLSMCEGWWRYILYIYRQDQTSRQSTTTLSEEAIHSERSFSSSEPFAKRETKKQQELDLSSSSLHLKSDFHLVILESIPAWKLHLCQPQLISGAFLSDLQVLWRSLRRAASAAWRFWDQSPVACYSVTFWSLILRLNLWLDPKLTPNWRCWIDPRISWVPSAIILACFAPEALGRRTNEMQMKHHVI